MDALHQDAMAPHRAAVKDSKLSWFRWFIPYAGSRRKSYIPMYADVTSDRESQCGGAVEDAS